MPTAFNVRFARARRPNTNNFFLTILFIITLSSFGVNSLVASGVGIKDAKGLLKFQKAADELQENYANALKKYEMELLANFEKVKSNESGLTMLNEKCAVSYHYGDDKDNVEQLERLYSSYGTTNTIQQAMVVDFKSCQREMKKLNMFVKSYADYVNSQRYLQDDGKNNGQLMMGKVHEILNGLKQELRTLDVALDKMKYDTEEVCLADHPLKIMLVPMVKDMALLSQIILDSEDSDIDIQTLERISSKRADLESTIEKRSREVDYLLKGSVKLKLYNNFYKRYNSILTQTEMSISNNNAEQGVMEKGMEVMKISFKQLNSTYEDLKGLFTASH